MSTQTIIDHYAGADDATRTAGTGWYASGHAEARRLARIAPDGFGPVRSAAVIAALSPRAQWSVNLRWAEQVIRAAASGDPCPAVHTTAMRAKAWRIAQGADPERELTSPKIRRFWRNLTGDLDPVTVDVWTARAIGVSEAELKRVGVYDRCEATYQAAARQVGVAPAILQAIVWIKVRGIKPSDGKGFR